MEKEMFFYLRRIDRTPIGVVALRKVDDSTVLIAASLCNPTDPWDRMAGINKAIGRLNSSTHSTSVTFVTGVEDEMRPTLAVDVLTDLLPARDPGRYETDPPVIRHGVALGLAQKMLVKQIRYLLTPPPVGGELA